MIQRLLARSRWLMLVPCLIGAAACSPAVHQPAKAQPAATPAARIDVAPIAEDQLAGAVQQLLLDGSESGPRAAVLVGVVKRMFARASERFDAGDETRGLGAVAGALYLVRSGELRPEMFDATATKALGQALEVVAPMGDEARSLAFLNLQAAALPKDDPRQAQILEHLKAMQAWMRDTRQRGDVESAGMDQRAYGELAMLQPTPETLKQGVAATEKWIGSALDFNAAFRPGVDNPRREQLMEAYRGIRTGALVLAALYLRNGDAAGASEAMGKPEVQRVTPPGLVERLDSAANGTDPMAWRELAALFAKAMTGGDEQVPIPPEIARGAAWGTMLEAYRHSPHAVEAVVPLADMLGGFGMPEAGMALLAEAATENRNATVTALMLQLALKFVLVEDRAHDPASARRVFRAAAPILATADALPDHASFKVPPARLRFAMGAVELRAGEPAAARALLEQALREQSSVHGWTMLAELLHQAGDGPGALQALTRALAAPDTASAPLARADVHLVAFRVHRAAGSEDLARKAIESATTAALEARSAATSPSERAGAERVLVRIATQYADRQAASRAVQRAFEAAGSDKDTAGIVAIEAASDALLLKDPELGRTALRRALEVDADDEDLVYVALWVRLTEQMTAAKPAHDDAVEKALKSIERGTSWASKLADWSEGKLDDAALASGARDLPQKTEASFYAAMRKLAAGDRAVLPELARIARGNALQLVESRLAEELTAPRVQLGSPGKPLP